MPKAPIREVSEVTNFDAKAGDSSRSTVFIVIGLAVGILAFILAFPKEPPKGLADEPERKRLPKELVEEALKRSEEKPPPDLGQPQTPEGGEEKTPEEGAIPTPEELMAAPKYGTLMLKAKPEVDVYDEATLLGRTPLTVKLRSGTHRLRFTDKNLLINLYKSYKIEPSGEQHDDLTIGESELVIHAPDGARIFLNGRSIGKSPLDPHPIYEGRYLLKVTHEGKTWSEWFNAPPGRKIEYTVRLQPD